MQRRSSKSVAAMHRQLSELMYRAHTGLGTIMRLPHVCLMASRERLNDMTAGSSASTNAHNTSRWCLLQSPRAILTHVTVGIIWRV